MGSKVAFWPILGPRHCRLRDFSYSLMKLSEKGYEQRSERECGRYTSVYGGKDGPKCSVSVARHATLQASPRLFGQFHSPGPAPPTRPEALTNQYKTLQKEARLRARARVLGLPIYPSDRGLAEYSPPPRAL
jgi:hypothetical protein